MHNQGFQRAPYSTNTNVYQPTVHQGKNTGRIPQQILTTPPPSVEHPNEQMSPVYPARSETNFPRHLASVTSNLFNKHELLLLEKNYIFTI